MPKPAFSIIIGNFNCERFKAIFSVIEGTLKWYLARAMEWEEADEAINSIGLP